MTNLTQIGLIEYLQAFGCEVQKVHKKGYYIMYNPTNQKRTGVPVPKEGSQFLLESTVSWVCKNLDVPVPDCATSVNDLIDKIRRDHNCDRQ